MSAIDRLRKVLESLNDRDDDLSYQIEEAQRLQDEIQELMERGRNCNDEKVAADIEAEADELILDADRFLMERL